MPGQMRRPLIVGNWKMNGSLDLLRRSVVIEERAVAMPHLEAGLCLPFPYLGEARRVFSAVRVGAQDCDTEESGARTGRVAARMLAEIGASLVVVGHSETRRDLGLSNADVARKAAAALTAGLRVIVCAGEGSMGDPDAGIREVAAQLGPVLKLNGPRSGLAIAYEPVWAIGTGAAAAIGHVRAMHAAIAAMFAAEWGSDRPAVLYGGSVSERNASELLAVPAVDGFLVGGVSLEPERFAAILDCAGFANTAP